MYVRGLGGDSGENPPWTSLAAEQTASMDEVPSSNCPPTYPPGRPRSDVELGSCCRAADTEVDGA